MTAEHPSQPLFGKRSRAFSFSEHLVPGIVGVLDAVAVCLAGFGWLVGYLGWSSERFDIHAIATLVLAGFTLTFFHLAKVHDFETVAAWPRRTTKVTLIIGLAALMLAGLGFALKLSEEYSRVWFFGTIVTSAVLVFLLRGLFTMTVRRWARAGLLRRNLAIVGVGPEAEHLLQQLSLRDEPWDHIIGVFDAGPTAATGEVEGVPIVGTLDSLGEHIRNGEVNDVIVALPWSDEERLISVIRNLREWPVNVCLGLDVIGAHFATSRLRPIGSGTMLEVTPAPLSGWHGIIKSVEDKVLGSILLLFFAPLMTLIAILVKLDSPGPVLFRQTRQGFANSHIVVWKFRSMYQDQADEHGAIQATKGDARVTRVGRFLRQSSLDELPQLFNVLKGDMSLVGPRPHALADKAAGIPFERAVDRYAARHKVKPGMTGWAQIHGWRGETDTVEKIKQRVQFDLYYIDNWSLWLDLHILAKTLWVILKDKNAY